MTQKYMQRIDDISKDPGSYLLFIAHTPINNGELHPNVLEVYKHVLEKMPDRHERLDYFAGPESIKALSPHISYDVVFRAWGEYTSGCVLNDLLRVKHTLGKNTDYGSVLEELCPELGVDFAHPRPWEVGTDAEKIRAYNKFVAHNIEYFKGKEQLPVFENESNNS